MAVGASPNCHGSSISGRSVLERRGDAWIQIRDIDGDDERFDVLFWQAQGPDAIFRAAWGLVVTAHEIKGLPTNRLRLQQIPVVIRPGPGRQVS